MVNGTVMINNTRRDAAVECVRSFRELGVGVDAILSIAHWGAWKNASADAPAAAALLEWAVAVNLTGYSSDYEGNDCDHAKHGPMGRLFGTMKRLLEPHCIQVAPFVDFSPCYIGSPVHQLAQQRLADPRRLLLPQRELPQL